MGPQQFPVKLPQCARQHRTCFKTFTVVALVMILLQPLYFVRPVHAQDLAATQRVIQGKVFAASGTAQSGAVVYLKDMKSLEIKTYIAQDGTYRFGQLGTQDDYQLWAEFGGHKSKVKNISTFDSRKFFDVPLHLEEK